MHRLLILAAHAHDLPTLLDTVLDIVLETTGVAAGAAWVGDARVVRGVDDSFIDVATRVWQDLHIAVEEPLVISDVFRDHLPHPLDTWAMQTLTPYRLRALLGVPIMSEEKCIGGIGVACFNPVRWQEEDIVLLSTVGREVGTLADRLLLIERLQRVNTELEEALQIKDTVLQNVSHELRTPLTLLKGYTDLMREGTLGELSPEQERALEVMRRNVDHLQFMIDRLLLMRAMRGEPLHREPIPLGEWLSAFVDEWRPVAQEKGFDLHLDVPATPLTVQADRQLLRQVMDNLLHNAMKFSPEGGVIYLRAWVEGDEVIISVSDQGIGIPPDRLEKIFEAFYQVDGKLARRFDGLGIGLTLCKQIVDLHGGRIWAESKGTGRGATFYVALPLTHN